MLEAHVVGHSVVSRHGDTHVEYELLVKLGQQSWRRRCRFSKFARFHGKLKRESGVRLPHLPTRSWWLLQNPLTEWFCDCRERQLEHYLRALLQLQLHLGEGKETLYSFLGVRSQLRSKKIYVPLPTLPEDNWV